MNRSKNNRWFGVLAAVVLVGTMARAETRPVLDVEFDYDFDGISAAGNVVPVRLEGINGLRQPGKFGQALKSGPGLVCAQFPAAGILSVRQGTVEMWVCPVDWGGREDKYHVFFEANGEGSLCLLKDPKGLLSLQSRGPGADARVSAATADISSWKAGQWHHIAGTWSGDRIQVYVDGAPSGTAAPALPGRLSDWFRIGDNTRQEVRTSTSLIDRVLVYDQPLTAEEIAAHAAGAYGTLVPVARREGVLTYEVNGPRRTVIARLEARGAYAVERGGSQAAFALAAAGRSPGALTYRPMQPVMTAEIPAADLPPGRYDLIADVRQGSVASRLVKTVVIPSTEWKGNRLGLEDQVLPPWTPLRTVRRPSGFSRDLSARVDCWGRTYEFDALGLPAQITARGERLLAGPVELKARIAGRPAAWSRAAAEVALASDTAVEINGSAETAAGREKVVLKTHLRLEYDGLVVYQLRLDVPRDVRLDELTLDIPLRSAVALLRHRMVMADSDRGVPGATISGDLPAGAGVLDNDNYIPYAWVGDDDRGLFWLCESAQYWPNWASKHAFETVREGDRVTMRFNLLKAGQVMPPNWGFEFAVQATPVKPLPARWRHWRWFGAGTLGTTPVTYVLSSPKERSYFGYPDQKDSILTTQVKDAHTKGIATISYSLLTCLSEGAPEFQWFGDPWHAGEGLGDYGSSDVLAFGGPLRLICPRSAEQAELKYSDFIVWKNREYMKECDLDGFYHDLSSPTFCVREGPGHEKCGWTDAAGKRHWNSCILPWRAIYRRLYAMVKEIKPDSMLIAHTTPFTYIPVLGYEDAYLDGEKFRTGPSKVTDDYLAVMPLGTFRAEFMGRQWGIIPYFLPELDSELGMIDRVEPTRGLAALLTLHDVPPLPAYSNQGVWKRLFDALDAFGYVDADFIPCFDRVPPGTTELKDVYVSVYKRSDGRALAIVGNLSKERRSGTVRLNGKRIGLPMDTVVSWPDRTPATRTGEVVTVDIPGQDYRMLLIGKAPAGSTQSPPVH